MCGIRLVGFNDEYIVDSIWYDGNGDWEYKPIPIGSEIIGIKLRTDFSFSIPAISFIIWEPRDEHKLDMNPMAISVSKHVIAQERKQRATEK